MKSYKIILLFAFLVGCKRVDVDSEYRFHKKIEINGLERTFTVVLPSNYYDSDNHFQAIIAMHGGGGSAKQMEESYELPEKAEAQKFIMIYPDGVQSDGILKVRTWNAGTCCEHAAEKNIDDVGFLNKMIDNVVKEFRIQPEKIYAMGMSNGGMMAYRLACELSDKIAAIAPVACTMVTTEQCSIQKAIPVIQFHSVLDQHVPINGGVGIIGMDFPAVKKGLETWAVRNGCFAEIPEITENKKYTTFQWGNCSSNSEIMLYVTQDGGHSWPGVKKVRIGGDDPSGALNANDLIFDFFKKH